MMLPHQVQIGEALTASVIPTNIFPSSILSYTFDIPSYPSHQVCLDYASACGEFIALTGLASLMP